MFNWIKKKIKNKELKDLQFRQRIIFYAHFEEQEQLKEPDNSMFKINLEHISDSYIILNIETNNRSIKYDIKNSDESIVYFLNFLEALINPNFDEVFYSSSTNNPTQFIYIQKKEQNNLKILLINKNTENNTKEIKATIKNIDIQILLKILKDISPFNELL